ncbi:MAG: methylated-DNA--[protein]-cysteine S-methyltransferase [Bacteroidota bacterium]
MRNKNGISTTIINSPLGELIAGATETGICYLEFKTLNPSTVHEKKLFSELEETNKQLKKLKKQLEEYFSGKRKSFDLKLSPDGTEFQQRVWNELLKIQFGKTRTYKEQSIALSDLKAIRAVATANGANPIAIIIPCHRIIGSDGSLTGYAGGLWRKKWLLEFEHSQSSKSIQMSLLDQLED